jgi:hypothetical protein
MLASLKITHLTYIFTPIVIFTFLGVVIPKPLQYVAILTLSTFPAGGNWSARRNPSLSATKSIIQLPSIRIYVK